MRLTSPLLFIACLAGPAMADVFLHVGEDGVLHYSNQAAAGATRISELMVELAPDNRVKAPPNIAGVALYSPHIEAAAIEYKVEPALVHAVITAESGYNASAVSRAGAQGLMQLMPQTAARYDVSDAFDPEQNIRGGVRYLSDLLKLFDNDYRLAVAAYNAGENAVLRHGRKIPPYRETQAYVPKVLRLYEKYRG
ncbi:MAG: transglycosylase SLT domain-containing protein [Pseudomonadota bacterium]